MLWFPFPSLRTVKGVTPSIISRSITLPRRVNNDQVEAVYQNGVLVLNLPIAPEAQPKRITVKTNGHRLQSNN